MDPGRMRRPLVIVRDVLIAPIEREVTETVRAQTLLLAVCKDLADHAVGSDLETVRSTLLLPRKPPIRCVAIDDRLGRIIQSHEAEETTVGRPIGAKLTV